MRIVFLLLWSFFVMPVGAQQIKSVLPYRIVGGKMIVEIKINDHLRSFIFDTGGQTSLLKTVAEELGLQQIDSLRVTDANGKQISFPRVLVSALSTEDGRVGFSKVPVMKLTDEAPFECFHADGLIGSDLLKFLLVEIDSRQQTITFTATEQEAPVSRRKMLPFAGKGNMPVVTLQAGAGNGLLALFDTGCPDFLSLKDTDYENLKTSFAYRLCSEGVGYGSISVGGAAGRGVSYRVEFPELSLGAVKFKNVSSETSMPPYTLLGMKLLEYGKVTIDYPKRRFYFESFKKESFDLTEKHYEVNLRVKEGDLIVSSVWSGMKSMVEVGDKIVKIDGKPVRKYDFCESIISGIPELKGRKKVKLTVLTRTGEKTINYQKK